MRKKQARHPVKRRERMAPLPQSCPAKKKRTRQNRPVRFGFGYLCALSAGGVQKEQRGQAGGLGQPLRLDKTAVGKAVTGL